MISNNSGFGPVEPVDVGFFIDRAWRFCWPNVIARAWRYQTKNAEAADLVEKGGSVSQPTDADRWYMDLLSQDPQRTKKALEAEGMLFKASSNAEADEWDKWVYTRILVRSSTQELSVRVKAASRCESPSEETSYERSAEPGNNSIGHFLVLTIPPAPSDTKYFAKALADYKATNKVYPIA